MHPYLVDADVLGVRIAISTGIVFTLLAVGVGGLTFFFLLPEKTKRGAHLVFLAAVTAGALSGARLLQFAVELLIFKDQNPLTVFAESGSTILGGIVGGGVTALIYKLLHRGHLITWRTFDAAAVAFAGGDAVLRIGCFFAGCCFGKVCADIPFALTYPPDWIMYRFHHLDIPAGPRLPFPLIAGAALLAVGLTLLIVYRKEKYTGLAASVFFILYGIYRFCIEFIRDEPFRLFIGPFSFGQWFALACLPAGIGLAIYTRLKKELLPLEPAKDR
jgi:phosphatidylglycerol:prolipoprotein diacylglycerol transferase